jgi:hypothetical protein
MKIPEQFLSTPPDTAKIAEMARVVSQCIGLVDQYRKALANMPPGKEEWEIEYDDPAVLATTAAVDAIRNKIRDLYPGVSGDVCGRVLSAVVEPVLRDRDGSVGQGGA